MKKLIIAKSLTIYSIVLILAGLIICFDSTNYSIFSVMAAIAIIILFCLCLFITGKRLLSLLLTSSIMITIRLLNQLKVHYFTERLYFGDFYVIADVQNWHILRQYPAAMLAIAGLILFILFNTLIALRGRTLSWRSRCIALLFGAVLLVVNIYLSQNATVQTKWLQKLPRGTGPVVNLFLTAQQMYYQPPQFGQSADYFLQKAESIQPITPLSSVYKPDVVVMLQESTVDASLFGLDAPKVPKLPMFNQPNRNLLRVQTFGGATWISEFSLLSGLNSDDFAFSKLSVFYNVVPHIQSSLFKEFRRAGYTTVVISPTSFGFYNAGKAYQNLGIEHFYQAQDLGYPARKNASLWNIPSAEMLNLVKKVMAKYSDKPLLVYVLTLNEHGPYSDNISNNQYQLDTAAYGESFVSRFNDYYPRIEALNQATMNFIDFIQQRSKPTLFLYFGDHQPTLAWPTNYNTTLPAPSLLTQYVISSNFPLQIASNPATDIALLGSLTLEAANIPASKFYQANIAMRYLCNGKLDECEDKQLVESYKHYIYQVLHYAGE